MRVVERFEEIPSKLALPIAVTIGSFDGLHLGHQAIFKRLRELAGPTGTTAVITFSNHPSDVLSKNPTPLIYPPDQKLALLKTLDIDLTVFLTFTKQTASNTYDQFLLALKKNTFPLTTSCSAPTPFSAKDAPARQKFYALLLKSTISPSNTCPTSKSMERPSAAPASARFYLRTKPWKLPASLADNKKFLPNLPPKKIARACGNP